MTTVRCGNVRNNLNTSQVAKAVSATRPNSAINNLSQFSRMCFRTLIAETLFAALSAGVELQCKSQSQNCAPEKSLDAFAGAGRKNQEDIMKKHWLRIMLIVVAVLLVIIIALPFLI